MTSIGLVSFTIILILGIVMILSLKKSLSDNQINLMSIELLIFYAISGLLITILLDKPMESQSLIFELLKLLISGYLGYLIREYKDAIK